TKMISASSPLNGEFEVVFERGMSRQDVELHINAEIFEEAPEDLMKEFSSVAGSPLDDVARFVSNKSAPGDLHNTLSARAYDDLSILLKSTTSTAVSTGPESAKTKDPLFRVVVVPTPPRSHAFVIMSLSHAISDGNTYHRILHMLLGSMDRRSGDKVPISRLMFDSKDFEHIIPYERVQNEYKALRDEVVPPTKLINQMKLGRAIGSTAMGNKPLRNFVAMVDLDELNRLRQEYSNEQYLTAAFGGDGVLSSKPPRLSANDILVCELGKILKVNRLDTNIDVRVKVLHEKMGIPLEEAKDGAGNAVAQLPFFRRHFRNPWYVRKAMIREDGRFMADPAESLPQGDLTKTHSYVAGNMSNWSGFTVGTELGKAFEEPPMSASLALHLPINVTASGTTPFEQALVFAPFQDSPKQLAVIFSTHYFEDLVARIDDPAQRLLKALEC
ncbi:MAG: hypothetical protein SGILL_004385, partial [Bacillariaceae sp.]